MLRVWGFGFRAHGSVFSGLGFRIWDKVCFPLAELRCMRFLLGIERSIEDVCGVCEHVKILGGRKP